MASNPHGFGGELNPKEPELSVREQEIFDLATAGYTDKEIAARLGIRPSTIKSYWLRIRQKTRALTRTQAISLVSNKTPVVQTSWWAALISHAPFSILVVGERSIVLEARIGDELLSKLIVGVNLRDYLISVTDWDRAMLKLKEQGASEACTCELAFQSWHLVIKGTLLPAEGVSAIYVIDSVEGLTALGA